MVAPGLNTSADTRHRWVRIGRVLLWGSVGASALLLLAKSVQNSGEFSRLQAWILLLNLVGVIALVILLTRKLWQLVTATATTYRDRGSLRVRFRSSALS